MEYRQLIRDPETRATWLKSAANEFGRLAQGLKSRNIQGTDTIRFIHKNQIPKGKWPTYARFVVDYRPQKAEPERKRLTVRGNLIKYPGPTSSPTADMTTFKLQVKSTLSTPNAKTMLADIKNYYLGTPLADKEYMKIHISLTPQEIIDEYDLTKYVDDKGFVYVEISKGMYGLPQAGILANQQLERILGAHVYVQSKQTPGFWKHKTRPISFVLVVDDFAVKYVGKENADHLLAILQKNYEAISIDWSAGLFIGIAINRDYKTRTARLSMPKYIPALLERQQHPAPKRAVHAPHPYNAPQFGKSNQLIPLPDTFELLSAEGIKRVQQIVGSLLYYSRAVDCTMGVTLSTLSSEQSKATKKINAKLTQLLDYCATHPDAFLQYNASDMILKIHSDAGYGNEPNFRSRAGGHHYLGNHLDKEEVHNGAIISLTCILKHVASSAMEAEIGALFINAREGVIIRNTSEEMDFPQPADGTPLITVNLMAFGYFNNTIKKQRSRAIDMRYNWVQDQIDQKQFKLLWQPGKKNMGDYFTKHHSPAHHKQMRHVYLANAIHFNHNVVSTNSAATATNTTQAFEKWISVFNTDKNGPARFILKTSLPTHTSEATAARSFKGVLISLPYYPVPKQRSIYTYGYPSMNSAPNAPQARALPHRNANIRAST